jgi:transposase
MSKSVEKWRIADELWAQIEPLLPPPVHPLGCHRPRVPNRAAMDAIFFVLRTGCQWNALNATGICSSSSAHRRFQEWVDDGVFERLWAVCLADYDAAHQIEWVWQALDGAMQKAPLGRGKKWAQSDRPWQAGREAQSAHRRPRRALGAGYRWREPAGLPTG